MIQIFDVDIIECFFFDAGETLISLYPSKEHILIDLLKDFDINLSHGEAKVAFLLTEDSIPYEGVTLMSEEERWDFWRKYTGKLLETARIHDERLDEITEELVRRFRAPENWKPYYDVFTTLDVLKGSGCRLGVISNNEKNLVEILRYHNLIDYFELVIISEEVGAEKPDPLIFEVAIEQIGLPAEKCAHVGDSINEDVKGARRAGMIPVWLDRNRLGREIPGVPKIYTLNDLPSLFSLPIPP